MKVLIDGKEVPCNNDVKVIWDDEAPEEDMELHMCATHEGIILDHFTRQYNETSLSIEATASLEVNDLIGYCVLPYF